MCSTFLLSTKQMEEGIGWKKGIWMMEKPWLAWPDCQAVLISKIPCWEICWWKGACNIKYYKNKKDRSGEVRIHSWWLGFVLLTLTNALPLECWLAFLQTDCSHTPHNWQSERALLVITWDLEGRSAHFHFKQALHTNKRKVSRQAIQIRTDHQDALSGIIIRHNERS